MNFEQYRPLALRTAKMFPTQRENLRHAALGLITEIGEFATEVKRIEIYGRYMTADMRDHMLEELGDAMWYVPLALHALGHEGGLPEIDESIVAVLDENTSCIADATLFLDTVAAPISMKTLSPEQVHVDNVVLAAAGVIATIDRIARMLVTTGDDLRAANIEKLRKRYPDAYSDEAAEARADKGGLPATLS